MKYIALIPARYQSSRFPGKPLAKIGGIEMIVRVCQQVEKAGVDCAVATDDQRIYDTVVSSGYKAVMTSSECGSGTERVEEAYRSLNSDADVVINVQGDEPFIDPEQIRSLVQIFEDCPDAELATLAKPFDVKMGFEALADPNLVKVVISSEKEALYFSRSVIPYQRSLPTEKWLENGTYYSHVGIYGYKASTLKRIVSLPKSPLEVSESLEQLRWLSAGLRIKVGETEQRTIGIDTPEDLAQAEKFLAEKG